MRILLINHYAGSKSHGMEYRPFYLAREWQKLDCETTIVAASFSHLRTRAPLLNGSVTEELVGNVPYLWLRTPEYEGNGPRRAVNMFAFTAQLCRYAGLLAKNCRPDVVITASTYPMAHVAAYGVAKRAGARLVCEVRDLWPLTLTELGGMPRWHPFILLQQWAEDFTYRKADWVTCTLPGAASHLREHGLAAHKFVCIPNGIASEEWQQNTAPLPPEHAQALSRLKSQGRFLLGYAGSHGPSNALGVFLEAAARLQNEPVTFVFVGQGPEKPLLEATALRRHLSNVLFLPPIPQACVPALLAQYDACLLGWQKKPIYRFGISPNKILDYMLGGKPILHAAVAANDPVAESGCGFSVPAEEPQAIAQAVTRLLKLPLAERQAMGERGRHYVQTHHDYSRLARRYLDILEEPAPASELVSASFSNSRCDHGADL